MALSAQTPTMRLVSGQLGSPERLRAGLEQLFVDKSKDPQLRIILFYGPRPSQIERDTGVFIFEGSTPAPAILGCYAFEAHEYISVAPRPTFIRGTAPLNTGQDGLVTPADPAMMVEGDDRDLFHVVFPPNNQKDPDSLAYTDETLSDAMRDMGGKLMEPTWALISLNGGETGNWSDVFPNEPSTEAHTCTVTRADGHSQDISVYNAAWPFVHYATVGHYKTEPSADLTVTDGPQTGTLWKQKTLGFHRLRLRLPSMEQVEMTTPALEKEGDQ